MINKQEAIDKLKKESWEYYDSTAPVIETKTVIKIINQIYEPKKPVVPQFVADWYEEHIGGDFEYNLYYLYIDYYEQRLDGDFKKWIGNGSKNKPIQTLVAMHFFGYEVEKEKLYTVEIPNPNKIGNEINVLMMNGFRQVVIVKEYGDSWKKENSFRLTEAEIKKDFAWAWQFAEDMEE